MDRPNVLWISLESFRADHTSLLGYERDTTPELARLASLDGWQTHDRCFAHGVWTRSSTASILTGTYPSAHRTGFDAGKLPAELDTVPELLGSVGYRTACVSPNPHIHPSTDLDRGFDRFTFLSLEEILREHGPVPLLKYARNVRKHSAGFTRDRRLHNFGYLINELAKRTVDPVGDRPEFLYVHHPDSHHPFCPPLSFRERFADEIQMSAERATELALDVSARMNEYMADGVPLGDDEHEALVAMYDTQLAYVDSLVRDLVEWAIADRPDDVIVVISGDHGEYLGEHGLLAHRIALDTIVSHVPLLVFGLPEVDLSDQPVVQHADVVRTILEMVGADTGQCQGVDLRTETREYAVTQRGADRTTNTLDTLANLNPDFDRSQFVESDVTSVQTADYRYERHADDETLYRIRTGDIDEPTVDEDRRERFAAFLDEWLAGPGQPVTEGGSEADLDPKTVARLKELGYMAE